MLGAIHDMRFLVPVVPGDRLDFDVKMLKLAADVALVEGTVAVGETIVARGRLGFARRTFDTKPDEPPGNP
jgi:3-hydroxymyristoyl/3-hydroxydecanoyl-(acyl carrier protein) dehydratase